MSVHVIRAFIMQRELLAGQTEILKKLAQMDAKLLKHDDALRVIWRELQPLLAPPPALPKKEIGFHVREDTPKYRTKAKESAVRLAEAVAQPKSELIRDATIQRFEFTFQVVWKTLKLYLERQGHECGGPRPTLKKAFAENLIPNPEEADIWLQLLDDRNLTSHAYDEALANRIYGHIVDDYAGLLGGMARKIQTLAWD